MTDGLLQNIIELEKQIQAEVAAEQVRAEQWRERELAELENSLAASKAATDEHRKQALEAGRTAFLEEGAAIEARTKSWCEQMEKLDERVVRDILRRHLAGILPGGDHDHPHGQG